MRLSIVFYILFSELFSIDIRIKVIPETAYVGSLVEIVVSVENLKIDEVPIFYNFEENIEEYSIINKNLTPNSISYLLQIWKVGKIIIPPISIDIKNKNNDISKFDTNPISLNIITNISNTANEIRSIKPMKEIKINSPLNIGLLILLIFSGLIVGLYLWQSKTKFSSPKFSKGSFEISALNKSIRKIDDLTLPSKINTESTERYYLKLSEICRLFFKEIFYIKATEMTSSEIADHFILIGIDSDLINSWNEVSRNADLAKYASQIPHIDKFTEDKKEYIKLLYSFYKIRSMSETVDVKFSN